jgi:hypothetical protein
MRRQSWNTNNGGGQSSSGGGGGSSILSAPTNFFSSLTSGVKNLTATTISEATKAKDKFFEGQTRAEQLAFGALWELPEPCEYCRECKTRLQPIMKHHCRICAGVFCDNCVPTSVLTVFERNLVPSALNLSREEAIRMCSACRRGEVPSLALRHELKRQLDEENERRNGYSSMKSNKIEKFQNKLVAKFDEAVNHFDSATGLNNGTPSDVYRPMTPNALNNILHGSFEIKRGSYYGENGMMRKAGTKAPAISGYFEIYNKSNEIFCIKLCKRSIPSALCRNGEANYGNWENLMNLKFEIGRPIYITVPPKDAVYTFFDPDADELDLVILFHNPHDIEQDKALIYDTKAYGVNPTKLSMSARVDCFEKAQIYSIASLGKNVLLKYKGHGLVVPREGNGMRRVGFFGYLSGKRYTEGMIDYETNADGMAIGPCIHSSSSSDNNTNNRK